MTTSTLEAGTFPARLRTAWREMDPIHRLLWAGWALCLLLGTVGVYQRLAEGHLPAGYGSYVPWGLWIAIYFHGVGIAGGVFAVAALGFILGINGFRHPAALRAAIVLAYAAVVPAFMAVWLDLGHMGRAANIVLSPSFTSMMAFNAWMYNGFLGVAAVAWWLSYRDDRGWLKPLLCLGILLSLSFPSQSGAFFGVVDAKPYWHSALLPLMFLTSALTAGTAMLLMVRGLIGPASPAGSGDHDPGALRVALSRLRYVVVIGVVAYFLMEFAELSIVFWRTEAHAPAVELVLFGPYWWVFWLVHVVLGGIVPLALLLSRQSGSWVFGAFLVGVTFISARLNVLVPGQAIGELTGLQEAFSHPRLNYMYHATAMEYLVGLFLVAVGMTVYFVGRRINKLFAARFA